jgi:hypothetical protein
MTDRKQRLRKLVIVQDKLKALHETKHAGFLAAASSARREAEELAASVDADGSLASLFPDLYYRRVSAALERERDNLDKAREEAAKLAVATMRTNMVEKSYKAVSQKDEREAGDRERLEHVNRMGKEPLK